MRHFLAPVFDAPGGCGLRIERTNAWLAERLEPAFDSASRTRGLLHRDGLAAGSALVIAPSQGVHTFGMRFALDIAAVDRSGRVLTCRAHVPPRRIVLSWRAFAFVELPAGTLAHTGLAVGDRLIVEPSAA